MKSIGYLCAALLALFASGCAMMKVSVAQNRRVGVIALIPDKVQTKYVGFWAFSNKGGEAEVPQAQFARTVTAATSQALHASGFEVVPLAYDPAALWQKFAKRHNTLTSYFADSPNGDTERKTIGEEMRALMRTNRLNAIAVVTPQRPTASGEATVGVGDFGFGLWSFDKEQASAYAMTQLTMFQGESLRTVGTRRIAGVESIEGVGFTPNFKDYPPEQQARLIQAMKETFSKHAQEVIPRFVKQ